VQIFLKLHLLQVAPAQALQALRPLHRNMDQSADVQTNQNTVNMNGVQPYPAPKVSSGARGLCWQGVAKGIHVGPRWMS
jgi:hypothetical protein